MQLKTILNSVERHKSFVYQEARWADPQTKTKIEIPIEPRANSRPICSGCGQAAPGYDRLQPRRFEFVPLWQIAVYFVYAMRRVDCPTRGVKSVKHAVSWGLKHRDLENIESIGVDGAPRQKGCSGKKDTST